LISSSLLNPCQQEQKRQTTHEDSPAIHLLTSPQGQ
jgi:hypothetical protein